MNQKTIQKHRFAGMAGAFILSLGCGASNAQQAPTVPEPSPSTDPTTVEVTGPFAAGPTAVDEPTAPATPPGLRAAADLVDVQGADAAKLGTVTFEQVGNTISVTGSFTGLTPGLHGFYVHEVGDCEGKRAANAGRHFNPGKVKHGPIGATVRHVGDFGNLSVDKDGRAEFAMTTDSLTIAPGRDSVVGRAIIIHERRDDGKTQPSGSAGRAVACGVIGI